MTFEKEYFRKLLSPDFGLILAYLILEQNQIKILIKLKPLLPKFRTPKRSFSSLIFHQESLSDPDNISFLLKHSQKLTQKSPNFSKNHSPENINSVNLSVRRILSIFPPSLEKNLIIKL